MWTMIGLCRADQPISSLLILVVADETGEWSDSDSSGWPDAGETVEYVITVSNTGTVTLKTVKVTDTSGNVNCGAVSQPLTSLGVGDSVTCTASRQVCADACLYAYVRG